MNHEQFNQLMSDTFEQMRKLQDLKGGEYAGDADRFENFKRNGIRLGLHPLTIWAVYANKHIDAINQYVADLQSGKQRNRSEPMEGRFHDVLNYFMLGLGMLHEEQNKDRQAELVAHKSIVDEDGWFYLAYEGDLWQKMNYPTPRIINGLDLERCMLDLSDFDVSIYETQAEITFPLTKPFRFHGIMYKSRERSYKFYVIKGTIVKG